MPQYAADTKVSTDRSRSEIERTLQRYGATSFAYGWEGSRAIIMFEADARRVRFELPLPDREDRQFTMTSTNRRRAETQANAAWEQACRQRWRALALVIKAKLEAVEAGITEFEDEFLAHLVLPNGESFGQWARPQIAGAYEHGRMPPMLALER